MCEIYPQLPLNLTVLHRIEQMLSLLYRNLVQLKRPVPGSARGSGQCIFCKKAPVGGDNKLHPIYLNGEKALFAHVLIEYAPYVHRRQYTSDHTMLLL